MNILVTGGDGFIGKNLVRFLQEKNHNIIVIDNHITSKIENDSFSNVSHINLPIEIVEVFDIPKVDVIFHLASVASPLVYKNNFNNVYNPNVKGTEKVIELAIRDGARLIYTSTSEVYGMLDDDITNGNGIVENAISISHLLTPRSIYPVCKRMGEELIYNYLKNGGNGIILRLFNVYGPNMDIINNGYGRVIPNFINSIINDQPIEIFGDGEQVRSFLWIDDLVEALDKIIIKKVIPICMNLGNAEPISINNLAALLYDIFNKPATIINKTRDIDDPLWRNPNCDLAIKVLNWSPKVCLREGLKKIIEESKNGKLS